MGKICIQIITDYYIRTIDDSLRCEAVTFPPGIAKSMNHQAELHDVCIVDTREKFTLTSPRGSIGVSPLLIRFNLSVQISDPEHVLRQFPSLLSNIQQFGVQLLSPLVVDDTFHHLKFLQMDARILSFFKEIPSNPNYVLPFLNIIFLLV